MPDGIAINQQTATVYVTDNASDTVAVFRAALP
jgi:DNA-binding beta-propeller fold protein YncE